MGCLERYSALLQHVDGVPGGPVVDDLPLIVVDLDTHARGIDLLSSGGNAEEFGEVTLPHPVDHPDLLFTTVRATPRVS